MWRQKVASRYYRRSTRSTAFGAWCRSTGATPSVYWVVLGRPYVTRALRVVDRTVGACPITCSPRHLTSHLFHSYISSTHSLRPQACVISFPCDLSVSQATSLGFWRQRDSHLSRYTSRIKTETSHQYNLEVIRGFEMQIAETENSQYVLLSWIALQIKALNLHLLTVCVHCSSLSSKENLQVLTRKALRPHLPKQTPLTKWTAPWSLPARGPH